MQCETYTTTKQSVKLNTLQSELPVKGEFTATVRNQTCGAVARFVISDQRKILPPLSSKSTLQELGMLQIREDPMSLFTEINDLRTQEEPPHVKRVK